MSDRRRELSSGSTGTLYHKYYIPPFKESQFRAVFTSVGNLNWYLDYPEGSSVIVGNTKGTGRGVINMLYEYDPDPSFIFTRYRVYVGGVLALEKVEGRQIMDYYFTGSEVNRTWYFSNNSFSGNLSIFMSSFAQYQGTEILYD